MVINLKVEQKDHLGWVVEFPPTFDALKPQQKLDLIQDALYDLNVKFKDVNENY
jgi:hypothetical protein